MTCTLLSSIRFNTLQFCTTTTKRGHGAEFRAQQAAVSRLYSSKKPTESLQNWLLNRETHLHGLEDGAAAPGVLDLSHLHGGVQHAPQRCAGVDGGGHQRPDEVAGGVQILVRGLLRAVDGRQHISMHVKDESQESTCKSFLKLPVYDVELWGCGQRCVLC